MKYATETVNRRANARHMQTLGGTLAIQMYFQEIKCLCSKRKEKNSQPPFNPNPFVVVSKHGNSLVVQSQDGAEYSRNTIIIIIIIIIIDI